MAKGVLRFFFEHYGGGCLWAGDDATRKKLDVGPVDCACYDLNGKMTVRPALELPNEIVALIEQLNEEYADYLNPLYPPDPSLWTQAKCESFNANVEELLGMMHEQLDSEYEILDHQTRYTEDPMLAEYLAENPTLKPIY